MDEIREFREEMRALKREVVETRDELKRVREMLEKIIAIEPTPPKTKKDQVEKVVEAGLPLLIDALRGKKKGR